MTPETLARIHRTCFREAPRPWSEAEFSVLLGQKPVFLIAAESGFAIGRATGGESELVMLAVAPESRRLGVGRTLLGGFERTAASRGAHEAFLEVAADNDSARKLYAAAGWTETGLRPGYYRTADGSTRDALVLRKDLLLVSAT